MQSGLTNESPLNRLLASTQKRLQLAEHAKGLALHILIDDPVAKRRLFQEIEKELLSGRLVIEVNRSE